MTSTITDVRAKLYTWKSDVQKIHENFCTNAADLINQDNISNDRWATYKFLSWLVVEVETLVTTLPLACNSVAVI